MAEPIVPAQKRRPRVGRYLLLAVIVLGATAFYGIEDRDRSDKQLTQWTHERAIPTVRLVSPGHATQDAHLSLPADIEAFYTAPIHSRVNGYVKMWYFDIGARVKAGDILARIDTPELDQQYEQAKGELQRAQADYNLAQVTAARWKALRASQAVSQQTADEKAGDAEARKAQVTAAQANLDRVKAMMDFKNIVAPFDGIVTARRIDVGALVSAQGPSDQRSLFDIAAVDRMRVYVRVPQIEAGEIRKGLDVTLSLPQYPGRSFVGAIDTTSDAISDVSRALLVEAIFPNPDNLLTPGAYAEARFDLPLDPHKLVVPASALIFRNEAPEVATVEGDKVVLKKISILVDLGTEIEIANGLEADDKIVASPSDSIETGDTVKVVSIDGHPVEKRTAANENRLAHEADR
jgi:RND family efflux transporter MFP subunit